MGRIKKRTFCGPLYFIFILYFFQVPITANALSVKIEDDSKTSTAQTENVKNERVFTLKLRKNSTDRSSEDFTCTSSYGLEHKALSNINILDLYEKLEFNNPADRGEWQLYWNINVDYRKWSGQNKLNVVVLPHSHCDPGWIITFEEYYERTTRKILNVMLDNLMKNSTNKFIWAEISFFSKWWDDLSLTDRLKVLKVVDNRQLEFVTGGWVMPDEANSHYYSILTQLFEGNQWLKHHLNYRPKNGWSIDPFGVSPTMAYILKRSGFSNMLIQRTHYIIKKHLGNSRELEFAWRQDWDSAGTTDILTQLMPFDSYTTPATCGPNKRLCAEFDFKGYHDINDRELQERSLALLDQYQKKGMLFKTKNVLVPLGGDFAWGTQREWTSQTLNYNKIFEYINSHPGLNAELKFGTLEDYFAAVRSEFQRTQTTPPVLSGDFFTYSERDDRYWSGYYTSRPFHKAMDRQLISHLRSAQIIYFLMAAEISKQSPSLEYPFILDLFRHLQSARRTLSLFQHHDGITGTSKDRVMEDYASKLFEGLKSCNLVMQNCFQVLTHLRNPNFNFNEFNNTLRNGNNAISNAFSFDFTPVFAKSHFHDLPKHNKIVLTENNPQSLITAFNPVAQTRIQLITVHVQITSPHNEIECVDLRGNKMEIEILPVFEAQTRISENTVQLNILAQIPPFTVKNYIVRMIDFNKYPRARIPTKAKIFLKNSPAAVRSPIVGTEKFSISYFDNLRENEMQISNDYMTVHFDSNGFAFAATVNGVRHPFVIRMFQYGTEVGYGKNSGLYVFMPDGEAKPLPVHKPFIKLVQGRFESYVEVWLDQVKHRVTLYNHPGFERYSVEVKNQVNIQNEQNFELMMRLHTAIQSGNTSFTDLNGFQMIKRKRLSKIPLAANYFPFPAATFIEDENLRMTILTRQPLGTASLAPGQIEIMMDRTLLHDDHLGVGQGSGDSLEIVNTFKIMLESVLCTDQRKEVKSPMLSLAAHKTLHNLLHPFKTFKGHPQRIEIIEYPNRIAHPIEKISDYQPTAMSGIACDLQLVDSIPIAYYKDNLDDHSFFHSLQTAFLVHRVGFDARFNNHVLANNCLAQEHHLGKIRFEDVFPKLLASNMKQTSLNFVQDVEQFSAKDIVEMQPHEIYGFVGQFQLSNSRSISVM